ncbi:rhomboid family intramembrane serine protease [Barnesiella sp. An22]|uniref:rhomboid family intramembrane serine protease n=1 Tax=Barnesiella sp. An22 TaxID=1965590 RepID=UPI000B392EB8|nr:rhomboid family intramembrane serine protease [Barnesiella sp. An22]OUO99061.1 rhomboid family intramembrane serine protease [Barnesiella sp. An22]
MAASIIDNLKRQFGQGSVLLKLIYINVAVFLLLRITGVVLLLFNIDLSIVLPYIEMPSDPYEFITHPWTLLTYMFVHYDVWHILFNMLWLYWFGQIFLTAFGEKQMVGLYLWGGIAGGLLYLLSYNLFPYFEGKQGLMCGASASIIAIVVATAFRMPDYKINLLFLGAISLKYIAIVTILIDLLSVTSANGGGHIAHLGGALLGYWFIVRWEKGKDLTAPLNRLIDRIVTACKPRPRIRVKRPSARTAYRTSSRPETDMEYRACKKRESDEIDAILDKIKKSGYTSLTAEEKKRLFEAGKK